MKSKLLPLLAFGLLLASCGSPRTSIKVRNNAEGTATDISVTQGDGGSTSVTVSPSAKMALDSVKFNIQHK